LAVHRYLPDRPAQLAGTAACADTGEFQQLIQLDMVAAPSEFDFFGMSPSGSDACRWPKGTGAFDHLD
jgi:hypothetical protein